LLDERAQPRHPIVDVGIPAYGRPRYIVETIESVLSQTFADWRLTISDDGAGGGDVANAVEPYLADPRVRYVPTGTRLGEVGNSNRLIEMAGAPYVAILHDDDRWQPEFLSRRVSFLQKHPECGFVFSGVNRIDSDGERQSRWDPGILPGVYQSTQFIGLMLRSNVVGAPVSVLMRRAALGAVGMFERRFAHIDYELWFRLGARFAVGYLGGWDADYRVHAGSMSHRPFTRAENVLALSERFIEIADRETPGLLTWRTRRRLRANIAMESIAFNALGHGDRAYASRLLLSAIRAYPPALLDARVLDWVRVAVGPAIRRRIAGVRARRTVSSRPGSS
jgi:glycosyltransferase involved in cell wall biosynthesis